MRRLVIRPGAIGDFILSLPAIQCLRSADYLEVWTGSANVPLIRFADRARSISSTGLDLLGIADEPPMALVEELRGFDSVVSWYGAGRPEFQQYVSALGLRFEFLAALPARGAAVHAADFYLNQVARVIECASSGIPSIPCDVKREEFAVIHPFASSPAKRWPLENFQRLAKEIEKNLPVFWCAGPEDPPLPGAVHIDDLYELACWLAKARLYVGNDSGITHLAAAVGTPVIAMFGPTDPAVWAPRGPNVEIRTYKWNS